MFKGILKGRNFLFASPIVAVVVLTDLASKLFVQSHVALTEEILVIPNHLSFVHIHNYGSAFGMFSQLTPGIRSTFFTVIIIVAVVVLIKLISETDPKNIRDLFAYGAIFGGAIGNFSNRVLNGHVTDFISVHWKSIYFFPAFNIADIAICIGVGILLVGNISSKNKVKSKES